MQIDVKRCLQCDVCIVAFSTGCEKSLNKFFKNNLGLAGILVAFILLSIGLRTKFDYNFWGLPPNFMEFNMYVHTMVSAIDGAN